MTGSERLIYTKWTNSIWCCAITLTKLKMPLYRPLYTVGWSNFHLLKNLQEPYFCIKEQLAKENSKLEFV